MTPEEKRAEFENSSFERLVSIMVFGTQGINADGQYFSSVYQVPEPLGAGGGAGAAGD